MPNRSNGKFPPAEPKRRGSQRALAKSVLRETAARMIDSVERATLTEIFEGGTRRTHTPEEFLAAFRAALSDATEYAGIRPSGREELLSQLVAVCMEELFSPNGRLDPAYTKSFGVDKVSGWT